MSRVTLRGAEVGGTPARLHTRKPAPHAVLPRLHGAAFRSVRQPPPRRQLGGDAAHTCPRHSLEVCMLVDFVYSGLSVRHHRLF